MTFLKKNLIMNLNDDNQKTDNVIYGEHVIYGEKIVERSSDTSTIESSDEDDEIQFRRERRRIRLDAHLSKLPQVEVPLSPTEKSNLELENEETSPQEENPLKAEVETIESGSQPGVINSRALPKHSTTYELEKFDKNALLILNQEKITGYQPRLGTKKDEAELKRTFAKFGFEVEVGSDLTKSEIMDKLREFGDKDYTDYGSVAVAVLTHGSKHGLIRAKDQDYSELEIINHLKVDSNPTLLTKPKIVIVQACRGKEDIKGMMVARSMGKIRKDFTEDVEPYTLPVESDMLILHSSYIGKPSHRDEILGSWFIQSLCSKINQLAPTCDLESILIEVKREVAIDKFHTEHNRRTFETDINKQMPVVTSTLIRKLYLRGYGEDTSEADVTTRSFSPANVDNSVLDNSAPNTPMLVQFGPCCCFLKQFVYMKDCLRHYLTHCPEDQKGQSLLDVANTFEDSIEFNTPKERMLQAMSLHLKDSMARHQDYYKYIYLYENKR